MTVNTSPLRLYAATPVRFGWSTAQPPENGGVLKVTKDDILPGQKPTDAFVQKVINRLLRKGEVEANGALDVKTPGVLGIVVDKNMFTTLWNQDIEQARTFYRNLANTVLNKLKNKEATKLRFTRFRTAIVSMTKPDGVMEGQDHRPTTKTPHFDPNGQFVSHFYLPTRNISGGNFQAYDIKQLLRDNPDLRIENYTDRDRLGSGNILLKFPPDLLDQYKIEFAPKDNGPVMVFINNSDSGAVAHGASEARPIDPDQPFSRAYERISLTLIRVGRFLEPETWRSIGLKLTQRRKEQDDEGKRFAAFA